MAPVDMAPERIRVSFNDFPVCIDGTGAPGARDVDPEKVQTLSIDRGEVIKLNGQPVALEQLTSRLTALRANKPGLAVVIRSHKDLTVQKLIGLMDCLKGAQITKVGIATQPAEGETAPP